MKHPPQEPDVVSGKKAAGVIGAAIASIVGGALVAWGIGSCRSRSLDVAWQPAERPTVPTRLQAIETAPYTSEAQGLEQHRLDEQRLSTYGWIDRRTRRVHVPIDVAIDLYLARQPALGARR